MNEQGTSDGAPAGSHVNPFLLVGLFGLGLSLHLVVTGVAPGLVGVRPDSNPMAYIGTVLGAQTAVCTVLLLFLWWVFKRIGCGLAAIGLRTHELRQNAWFGLRLYLRMLPLLIASVLVTIALYTKLRMPFERSAVHKMAVESSKHVGPAVAFAAMAVAVAPVLEETLFRGLLYTGLRQWMGFWTAATTSAVCFSLVHTSGSRLPTMVLGFALAWMYERRGTLVSPIAAHALHNALFYGALLVAQQ